MSSLFSVRTQVYILSWVLMQQDGKTANLLRNG